MQRRFLATVDGQEIEFLVEKSGERRIRVTRDGRETELTIDRIGDSHYLALEGARVRHLGFTRSGTEWQAFYEGEVLTFDLKDEKAIMRGGLSGGLASGAAGDVISPMPGRVVKILVQTGAVVKIGEPVAVVEAMKMENEFKAKKAGTVKEIKVSPGDTVEGGAVLVVIG
jgi:biotin carboxyl carrier protein